MAPSLPLGKLAAKMVSFRSRRERDSIWKLLEVLICSRRLLFSWESLLFASLWLLCLPHHLPQEGEDRHRALQLLHLPL